MNSTIEATLPPAIAGVEPTGVSAGTAFRRRGANAATVLGLWLIPMLVSTTQTYFFFQSSDKPHFSFGTALVWQGIPWLFWALMTPLVVWLSRRCPLERGVLLRHAGVHLLANIAMAPCHVAVVTAAGRLARQEWYLNRPFLELVGKTLGKNAHLELFIYWGVLAMVHAFDYHRRYRERAVAAAQLETKLVQAELQALKMQLHPHFLFNTLHAIAVLVRKQETQASVRMITGLSDLLRMALENAGKQVVPLKQELDFLNRYLDIEKIRFQDRLTVSADIASDALEAEIPNLVLQPIVENAIRHGIAPRASLGRVEISARVQGSHLAVQVIDDGRGLCEGWCVEQNEGMGLGNVRARLKQLYPGDHRLSVAPRAGGGVVVTVEVPFRLAHAERSDG